MPPVVLGVLAGLGLAGLYELMLHLRDRDRERSWEDRLLSFLLYPSIGAVLTSPWMAEVLLGPLEEDGSQQPPDPLDPNAPPTGPMDPNQPMPPDQPVPPLDVPPQDLPPLGPIPDDDTVPWARLLRTILTS